MRPLTSVFSTAVVVLTLACSPASGDILVATAGPISGDLAYLGEQQVRGVEMALADLNAEGGVLGQTVRLQSVDDACDAEQAVAAAGKVVTDGAVVVIGHVCSAASIPAAAVYARAGVLMISPSSTNPQLTEQNLDNVFRLCGRDDQQGAIAGDYLAEHWAGKRIAILHDGTVYGQGLAEETRKRLNILGGKEALFRSYTPGERSYLALLRELQAAGIEVVYLGGYSSDAGLMVRQAHDVDYPVSFLAGDGISAQDFWLLAGPAGEGTMFTSSPDARRLPQAAALVERFRAAGFEPEGSTLDNYAAVQIWAQAVRGAGTTQLEAVASVLHRREFETVLGRISFDGKGDTTKPSFAWYVWRDGDYVPKEDLTR
jgi:branched-chain amino acid transport system substrate-binding protein